MNTIKQLQKEIHEVNKSKGFWEQPREIGTLLMLVTTELSEALEADRNGKRADLKAFEACMVSGDEIKYPLSVDLEYDFKYHIKDTFEDELADAAIRIFDIAEGFGIDLEKHIRYKVEYNKARPYKHGKAY